MLYFEDFSPGQILQLGTYEVSREEILEFAGKYDPQPFHVDEAAAQESMFGGLIASGWHSASICMRLFVDAILNRAASMGSPGVDELRWKRPVRPGDRLTGDMRVLDVRPFRKGIGIVRGRVQMKNQEGKLVMSFIGQGLYATRNGD